MKVKTKIELIYLLLLLSSPVFGQLNSYEYKRELLGIKDQWHKIILPNAIFSKLSSDFSDIRIVGLTKTNDTIEAPYILKFRTEKILDKNIEFKLINQSKTEKGYYFTFEIATTDPINQIQLEFEQQNFDWKLALEGSQNQEEWFSILEDYRILSINNELTNYQFTKLSFPSSKYRYFRIFVASESKPDLKKASISAYEIVEGRFRNYKIYSKKIEEERENKQTRISLDLKSALPVCKLKIFVKETFDYYRPITIKYLADSIKTEKGWKYNYVILTTGTLNSIEKNEFRFNSKTLKKIEIIIDNQDNQALHIDSFRVDGYVYELNARFDKSATYFLNYGNSRADFPRYDIERFVDKIPKTLSIVSLGEEQLIGKEQKAKASVLFQNKIWLWLIMGIIIVVLGGFSLTMLRKKA